MNGFSLGMLARRGIIGHARSHAAVGAGVALASTVLVGALLVGASVRESLRGLALESLGRITHAIAPPTAFEADLAERAGTDGDATAVLVVPATLSHRSPDGLRRASGVTLLGVDERFARLAGDSTPAALRDGDITGLVLTEALAAELGVAVGDRVVVRSTIESALPSDSPLGEKLDTVGSTRIEVAAIVPPRGLARFAMRASQSEPRNAFVPLAVAQRLTEQAGKANLLLAADHLAGVEPTLDDLGLSIDAVRPEVWQLESRQLVLPPAVVNAARDAWADRPVAEVTTYLANTLRVGERSVPYSTVSAVGKPDAEAATLSPFPPGVVPPQAGEVVLNRWAADRLDAAIGDDVEMRYYEPESTHGVLREAPAVTLRLSAIVDLADELGDPTAAADPRLTPALPGVTDAETIANWDLPFELVEPIEDADEDYWDAHSTTPKAFVAPQLAGRLWVSRWGVTSLLRVSASDAEQETLAPALLGSIHPQDVGYQPIAIRQRAVAASSGSTPFDVLFLLFSGFLIGSALLLVTLLVWLAIDTRASELALLGAAGFDPGRRTRLLLAELAPVTAAGAFLGGLIGIGYAATLLWLLRTVWIDAIGEPFLRLAWSPGAIAGGAAGAWLAGMAAGALAVRSSAAKPPRTGLAGATESAGGLGGRARGVSYGPIAALVLVAGVATMSGGTLRGEAAAGAFFAGGGAALAAAVLAVGRVAAAAKLMGGRLDGGDPGGGASLVRLAVGNTLRARGRSQLTLGLVAASCFLLIATAAFRLDPTASGVGGFGLVATSDTPLVHDLATPEGRWELGLDDPDEAAFADERVYGFRVQPGADASCSNLYQAQQPRLLGATPRFLAEAADAATPFAWAEVDPRFASNPWEALLASPEDDGAIPVVLDFNTAVYSLKLYAGVGSTLTVEDEAGGELTLRVAGLLKNSVLQGDAIMAESRLLDAFPSVAGYRFFLLGDAASADALAAIAEDRLSDFGFDAESAGARLARFLAVQNTYLSTFQALGALGLLLGVVGLAVAQTRNLNERRGELAQLRAAGFGLVRLRRLVLAENLLVVLTGLVIGVLAAAWTLAPLVAQGDTRAPWAAGTALLAAVAAAAIVSARVAGDRVLRAPIVASLRGD